MLFKMWIVFSVLIAINLQSITCMCLYENYDFDYPPVFTQKFDRNEFIVKSDGRPIVVSEGSYIKAYCDSNFSMPVFEDREEPISDIHVKCLKGILHYNDDDRNTEVQNRPKLACHGSQPTFKRGTLYCAQSTAMDFGLQVNQNQIVLSSFCYDVKNMETSMIRYHSGDHSTILESAKIFDESTYADMPINFIDSNKVRTDEINSFFNINSSRTSSLPQFSFDYLVPAERLVKGFAYQTEVLEGPSSIPWWTNLKEGNWKIFQDILEKKILSKECDIYTGIIHYNQIALAKEREQLELERKRQREPSPYRYDENSNTYYRLNGYRNKRTLDKINIQEKDLSYMSRNVVKSIPFYVWTYIKPRNTTEKSAVIIAINSPFVEVDNYRRFEFCTNVCREFDWLKEFETASMPALGYMFCCHPHEASKVITDIANIN